VRGRKATDAWLRGGAGPMRDRRKRRTEDQERREMVERIQEAYDAMPHWHCTACHHEWDGWDRDTCDWCGEPGRDMKKRLKPEDRPADK